MKANSLNKYTYGLLLLMLFSGSCARQSNLSMTQVAAGEAMIQSVRQSTLLETQGKKQADNVHCGLQDKAGNLWFGTTGDGVYRYDGKAFTNFTKKDGLSSNTVWSIFEDNAGNIWFGTSAGLCRYIPSETVTSISISVANVSNSDPRNSPDNAVWSILQDRNGVIWFGTDEGIYRFNGKTFSRFLDDPSITNKSGLTLKSIQCMLEDKKGNLWFGSGPMAFEGICLYDGKSLTNFKPKDEGWIRNIVEDKRGALLFATRHIGVYAYDGKNFSEFPKPQELRSDSLNNILVSKDGDVWYASDYVSDNDHTTGGVWKSNGKSFIQFTKKDGLSNSAVFSMTEDRDGNIWLGSRGTGLFRYDGKSFTDFSKFGSTSEF